MFSYWGEHGLGDSSTIPIGHGKSVEQIDGTRTYIKAEGFQFETLHIREFATTKDFLFARKETEKNDDNVFEYLVWNLKTNKAYFFRNYSDMDSFVKTHEISEPIQLQDFWTHYKRYWNGWRFWFLP